MNVCVLLCVCVCVRVCMHIYMHRYIYIYIGHTNWLHGSDDDEAAMVPAYQEFVGLLFEPSAAPLLGMVESFLQALLNSSSSLVHILTIVVV